MEEQSVVEVLVGVLGGGGVVGVLAKYIVKQQEARIADLKEMIIQETKRADSATETAMIAAQSLPAIEELLKKAGRDT